MRCQRCGNQIRELFIYKNKLSVCRRCLVYKENKNIEKYLKGEGIYKLNYELTYSQKEASEFVLNHVRNNKNCILSAVTGAGKTILTSYYIV